MSLDVHLTLPGVTTEGTGIYFRENGQIRELTRAEWNQRFPDREPVVAIVESESVYSANITHNLGKMADEAGIYDAMWRPDEHNIAFAYQLVDILKAGLAALRSKPEHYKQFNPENGWGNYNNLIEFTERYLNACEAYPMAKVSVSR